MATVRNFDALLGQLVRLAEGKDRVEIDEPDVINVVSSFVGSLRRARDAWESLSDELRKRVVKDDYVVQWDMFRRAVRLSRLPTVEELESTCELYQSSTPRETERRIRSLSGIEFEIFLASVLTNLPEFREISTTRQSHDEGIDLRGLYVPSNSGPQFTLRGQAKQVQSAVTAGQARDFIGALHITGERGLVGLFVSTGGFTEPAREALEKCNVRIMQWDMKELVSRSQELTTRKVDLSFGIPDDTFWDELLGRT